MERYPSEKYYAPMGLREWYDTIYAGRSPAIDYDVSTGLWNIDRITLGRRP